MPMNVKINDTMYEDVQWNGSTLTLPATMTLAEAEEAFDPDSEDNVISVYENGEETQRYYNRGIQAIRMTQWGDDPRRIEVDFNASQLSRPVEEAIQADSEATAEAVIELAQIYADMENYKSRWNSMADVIDAHARILQNCVNELDEILSPSGPLVLLEERLNDLASRLPQSEMEESMAEMEHEYVPTSADAGTLGTHDEDGNPIDNETPIEAEGTVEEGNE